MNSFVGRRIARPSKQIGGAFKIKLRNRRVHARGFADGSYEFKFKRYDDKEGILTQSIRLSEEAVAAMWKLIQIIKESSAAGQRPAARGEP